MRRRLALAIAVVAATTSLLGTAVVPAGAASGDKVDAKRLVLRADDLSGTWTASKPDADDGFDDKKVQKCLGVKGDPDKGRTGHAEGPDLENADQVSVSSSASVFGSAKALQASLKRFDNPKLTTCLKPYLSKQLEKNQVTLTDLSVEELPVTVSGRGKARAFRLAAAVEASDGSGTVYSDEILAWDGRYGTSATVTTVGAPPSSDVENEVLSALLVRLRVVS